MLALMIPYNVLDMFDNAQQLSQLISVFTFQLVILIISCRKPFQIVITIGIILVIRTTVVSLLKGVAGGHIAMSCLHFGAVVGLTVTFHLVTKSETTAHPVINQATTCIGVYNTDANSFDFQNEALV
jgi:lysylphosphatidylglycerol synthetase-like protein (DUF2156 family)